MVYYEIDPDNEGIARTGQFLTNARDVRLWWGTALAMQKSTGRSRPTTSSTWTLLRRRHPDPPADTEAVQIYLERLKDDGVIPFTCRTATMNFDPSSRPCVRNLAYRRHQRADAETALKANQSATWLRCPCQRPRPVGRPLEKGLAPPGAR